MALGRSDMLGSALILWAGAGLLALFLLCNPAAATLQDRVGPTRLWGLVLGAAFLGLALSARRPLAWLLPAAALPLVLLPPPLARWLGPASLALGLSLGVIGLFCRRAGCREGVAARRKGPARRGAPSCRPAPYLRPARGRLGRRALSGSRRAVQNRSWGRRRLHGELASFQIRPPDHREPGSWTGGQKSDA